MTTRALALAAAFAAGVTGAEAADLAAPPIIEPVDYVRICDAFGVGFFYIPGTETCLRVAGRIRADYNVFFDWGKYEVLDGLGYDNRGDDGYRFRARAYIYMDSRTSTEFGLLRTFTEVYFTSDFSQGTTADGLQVELNRAFIQFGGLTFGRTQSFFDFTDATFTPEQFFNPDHSDTTTNLAAYTFAFGNGFSASVSIEDSAARESGILNPGNYIATGGGIAGYGGLRYPDIVGNIRVDQAWGGAQIMGAGHYVHSAIGSADSKYGWAVGGGVFVNIPFGASTQLGIQAAYTNGALSYVAETPIGPGVGDGIYVTPNRLDLVDAWSVSGGGSFSFTPTVSIAWQGGVLWVDQSERAGVSYDFRNYDAQGFIGYSPVAGFTLGLGAEYKYVDTDDFDDGSGLTTFFRAQRTF